MPFVAPFDLEDMINPAAVPRAQRRIADAAGDRLKENTRRNTPVDVSPGRSRRGRRHLRDTIDRGPVEPYVGPRGRGHRVVVGTEDPIAPYVEWDTRPHDIPNAFGYGNDFGIGGRFEGHFHPGTKGQHMFALGALKTEAELDQVAREPLRQFAREFVRAGRVSQSGGTRAA